MLKINVREFIFKVCDFDLWQDAKRAGVFVGAEIDLTDGYIHFSTASQLRDTLACHFAGRDELVLLTIDSRQLDIVWETARGGDQFPHLYGHLPLHYVVALHNLQLSDRGDHILPENFLCQFRSDSSLLSRSFGDSCTGVP